MQTVQAPDRRIIWPPEHSPTSAVVFAQNIVEIAAGADAVWSLLIDCVEWPQWYKLCSDVSIVRGGSVLNAGSKFRFKTLRFYFEPEIKTFEQARMLVWSARGPAGTSGAHAWYIEQKPGGCRVITEEAQKGLLLRVVGSHTRRELLASHEEWLRALKETAEGRWGAPQRPAAGSANGTADRST